MSKIQTPILKTKEKSFSKDTFIWAYYSFSTKNSEI